jgi:hypothetical protein
MSRFHHIEDFHAGFSGPGPGGDFLEYRLTRLGMVNGDQEFHMHLLAAT